MFRCAEAAHKKTSNKLAFTCLAKLKRVPTPDTGFCQCNVRLRCSPFCVNGLYYMDPIDSKFYYGEAMSRILRNALELVRHVGVTTLNLQQKYIAWFNSLFPVPTDATVSSDEEYKKLPTALANILLCGFLTAVFLLVINLFVLFSDSEHNFGTFGDFLGGVLNPFLTFLTLFGLIATIVIQRQELRLARQEYQNTAMALETQAVESTFFNLLDLHNSIVDSLDLDLARLKRINDKSRKARFERFEKECKDINLSNRRAEIASQKMNTPEVVKGRACFEAIILEMAHESNPDRVHEYYRKLNRTNNHLFGHYFRNLYQILCVIERGKNREKNKAYARILRSQLSFFELAVLFVNCLNEVCDKGEFRDLLVKYEMLEHIVIEKHSEVEFLVAERLVMSIQQVLWYSGQKRHPKKLLGGAFGENPHLSDELRHT